MSFVTNILFIEGQSCAVEIENATFWMLAVGLSSLWGLLLYNLS